MPSIGFQNSSDVSLLPKENKIILFLIFLDWLSKMLNNCFFFAGNERDATKRIKQESSIFAYVYKNIKFDNNLWRTRFVSYYNQLRCSLAKDKLIKFNFTKYACNIQTKCQK